MKNRLPFLLPFAWFAVPAVFAVNVDVMLEDGFKASGKLISLNTARDSLTIATEGTSSTFWDIKLARVHSIHMEQAGKEEKSTYTDKIVLRGGWREIVPATMQSIDDGKAVFTCPFRQTPVSVPKHLIRAIKLHDPGFTFILSDLPSFNETWIPPYQNARKDIQLKNLADTNPERLYGNALLLPSASEWGKDMNLNPSSFELRLDSCIPAGNKTNKGDKMILFFGGKGTRSPLGNPLGLYLKSDGFTWKLSISDSPLAFHHIMSLPIPTPGKRHRLFLSVTDTDKGTSFSISSDGNSPRRIILPWTIPEGSWFSFSILKEPVELYGMRLFNKWDLASNMPPDNDSREDRINTTDGKTIAGDIISYQNHNDVVTVQTQQGPMDIPAEYSALIIFAHREEEQQQVRDDFADRDSVVLQNGGRLYGTIISLQNDTLTMEHPVLGTLSIPGTSINRLDFFNQEPPTRSTP